MAAVIYSYTNVIGRKREKEEGYDKDRSQKRRVNWAKSHGKCVRVLVRERELRGFFLYYILSVTLWYGTMVRTEMENTKRNSTIGRPAADG